MNDKAEKRAPLPVLALPFFCLLFLACNVAFAGEFVLENDVDKRTLPGYMEFFEDKEKAYSIDDISNLQADKAFQPLEGTVSRFGFSSSAFWVRFEISNPTNEDKQLFLEIRNSYLDQVEFFLPDGNGGWIHRKTGELFPFATRDVKTGSFIFRFTLLQQSKGVYFLRLEGESALSMPVLLFDTKEFQETQMRRNMFLGFYLGATSILMLISLILFFQLRDSALFFFFLYLVFDSLIFSNFRGLTAQFLWPEAHPIWANQLLFVFYSLYNVSLLLFARAFLDTSRHVKMLDRVIVLEIFFLAVCIIPGLFVPYRVGAQVLLLSVIICNITALLSGIICLYRKKKPAGYFLLACTPITISTTLFILLSMNILPMVLSDFLSSVMYGNYYVRLALLSIAVIGRVKLLQDEKQFFQERISSIKDDFFAKTSHELRTPLHGIIGIAESLAEPGPNNKLSKPQQEKLNVILAAGRRLASLVDDILDVSRLKHNEIILNKKPVDFYQLSEVVLTLCRTLARGKDLVLINTVPRDLPPVFVDENRLQQIMHNLVGNAIKYTDQGRIQVSARLEDERMLISIQDTGRGIRPDQLDTIFLTFEQVHSPGGLFSEGTGLGLSIVKRLVELHDGDIKVVSEPGKGSVFTFTLPVSSKPVEPAVNQGVEIAGNGIPTGQESSAGGGLGGMTRKGFHVLVVDDEPVNLQVVRSHLTEKGYTIQTVATGEQALAAIEQRVPHLILLDVMMPGMSGFEVCRTVREQFSRVEVAIIFLTAKNQINDLVEGFSLGANDYLRKPFSKSELLTRVEYHLENHQMANRLLGLSSFSLEAGKLKDVDKQFKTAFHLICEQLAVESGILLLDEQILASYGESSASFNGIQFKNDKAGNSECEITFHCHRGFEFVRVNPLFNPEIEILVTKEEGQVFNQTDIEYIRNILVTIKTTRNNLREIISDGRLLSGINRIRENLSSIIYIRSQRNYCLVSCDDLDEGSFELRISLKNIQTFFQESELLKINRSTLINPTKVKSVQRVSSQKYRVVMAGNDTLPISRSLEKQVRGFLHTM